jgi:hypothetical protein
MLNYGTICKIILPLGPCFIPKLMVHPKGYICTKSLLKQRKIEILYLLYMICIRFEGFYESFIRNSKSATMKSKLELKLMGPCVANFFFFFAMNNILALVKCMCILKTPLLILSCVFIEMGGSHHISPNFKTVYSLKGTCPKKNDSYQVSIGI